MRERIRNGAAIVVAGLCLALAIQALSAPQLEFTGITLKVEGSELVVATVDPASPAKYLIQQGTVIQEVNYAPWATVSSKFMDRFLRGDFVELGIADPSGGRTDITFPESVAVPTLFIFVVGVGLLFGIALWVRRGHAGEALRPFAIPLAVATAAPLILAPTAVSPSWLIVILAVCGGTIALLLLADGWVARIARPNRRLAAAAVSVAAALGYVALEIIVLSVRSPRPPLSELSFLFAQRLPRELGILAYGLLPVLAGSITLVPAVTLLASGRRAARTPASARTARSSDWLPYLLAASTPIVVSITYGFGQLGFGLSLPLIWLLIVVFVLQTNAQVQILRMQRDDVVAATEVERARLAADLHDDALQEMTVLVRRLDETGDESAAALARSIADRLREVCGELRLPILDELGAGAALEWLVARVGETSGGQVVLERDDGARPPVEVELAVFRVAQEALANAVAHGAPPIVVRYTSAADRASLSITDQGAGISPDAAATAARSGHYGLLNMRQRAEQIGARIDVRRPPTGGTTIGLNWSSA
jgi:signal transduction histidine kinase